MSKKKTKNNKKKYFIVGGLIVLVLVVVALVIFGSDKEEIIKVQVEKVIKHDITEVVSATGKIHPTFQVELRPEVTGEIVELPVVEGQKVKKGQLLIRLKPDQYIARKNRAEASYESAKATLKVRHATLEQVKSEYARVKGLYEKGLASDKDLESAKSLYLQNVGQLEAQKASVLQAEENFKDAKVELAKTAIYSPIDGTISVLNVELSERVLGSSFSQGTHLMTVADLNNMEARVDVDENDVVRISVGDTATVEIDAYGDKQFTGLVYQIGNSAKTSGLGSQEEVVNFEVKIKLIDFKDKIRPGMSCDADIQTETKYNVIAAPIQSVTARMPVVVNEKDNKTVKDDSSNSKGNQTKAFKRKKPDEVVFIVVGNKAKQVKVKTGISDDTFIEIVEGLKGGEDVVSGPYRAISKELKNDSAVMIEKNKKMRNKSSDEK